MKRSDSLKRTPLSRGTKGLTRKNPMRARPNELAGEWSPNGGGVALVVKRAGVRRVSSRRAALNAELARVVATKRKETRYCEGQAMWRAAMERSNGGAALAFLGHLQACRVSEPREPHHKLKRSRGTDATLVDPTNIVLLCSPCHLATETDPRLATEAGLLIPSWERSA